MLTPQAIELFDRCVLCWLATADADGNPSVSPKEVFAAVSATEIRIAHIASPHSSRNIAQRPAVCVSAVDVFEQHGYQVYGSAQVITADSPEFGELARPLVELAGPDFPIKGVIQVSVEKVSRIVAPSSWLHPDVPAPTRRAQVLANYGVTDAAS